MAQSEKEKAFENLISECDLLIRSGRINAVANQLSKFSVVQVPRKYRQALAKICRRAGLVSHGLRLLQPLIRNETDQAAATPGEICEYAVLLSRNGSVQEALTLLSAVNALKTPEVLTSQAYCYMAQWEYSQAASLLEEFLKVSQDSYGKMISSLNLASCYLGSSKFNEAFDLCTQVIELAQEAKAPRLVGNCLEVRGQVHFHRNDFSKARADLDEAHQIFHSVQTYDQLFIEKWQSVMESIESNSVQRLIEFRKKALFQKHWESVREADLWQVKVRFNQKLLDSLIHGTSLPAYRERIQKMIGHPVSETFVFGSDQGQVLDLQSGSAEDDIELNSGKKIHRTIAALIRDFYVPRNMGSLFAELYPDEYFNINSSPVRIRQLLSRTRKWLAESEIPASIEHFDGTYRLEIKGAFGIRLNLRNENLISLSLSKKFQELKQQFRRQSQFTALEACQKMNWSRSTFRLVIQEALQSGAVQKTGIGKSTCYEIVSSEKFNRRGQAA